MRIEAIFILTAAAMLAAAGCSEDMGPRSVRNRNLTEKIPAIKGAVRGHDLSQASQLVADLESDDPAVRFYAIQGLRRLTGETFGYRYYEEAEKRQPAVEHWQKWLKKRGEAEQRTTQQSR